LGKLAFLELLEREIDLLDKSFGKETDEQVAQRYDAAVEELVEGFDRVRFEKPLKDVKSGEKASVN
jgi:hypothetical protein